MGTLADGAGSVLAEDPLKGTRYEALRIIGLGGLGAVYEAVDRETQRRVAVKVVRPHLAEEPDIRQRAALEDENLARLARLRHPRIVERLDAGETAAGIPFIVMELLQGHTLASELAEHGPPPVLHAIEIVLDVLEALDVVHSVGLVHRDLKLENIFLLTDGRAKLLDFGLAKRVYGPGEEMGTPLTAQGAILGTPRYMSPEQAAGLPLDARSDLYTVGYIFYTLLTGQLPFEHLRSDADVMLAHAILPGELPSEMTREPIPAELDDLVVKALEKEPGDRFQTALEFADELAGIATAMRCPQGWLDTTVYDPPPEEEDEEDEASAPPSSPADSERPSALSNDSSERESALSNDSSERESALSNDSLPRARALASRSSEGASAVASRSSESPRPESVLDTVPPASRARAVAPSPRRLSTAGFVLVVLLSAILGAGALTWWLSSSEKTVEQGSGL